MLVQWIVVLSPVCGILSRAMRGTVVGKGVAAWCSQEEHEQMAAHTLGWTTQEMWARSRVAAY